MRKTYLPWWKSRNHSTGHELYVDEGEHEGDDEDDNIEGLKKENINENEDSLEKPVENVTKLVQGKTGMGQGTFKKRTPVLTKNLWKMWQYFYKVGMG